MTSSFIIQVILVVLALAVAIQYARQGLKAYLGPVLFHVASAILVGVAMAAGWQSIRALGLQVVFVVAPYVLVTGYRLGMERALSSGDFTQAVTMARSRALLLPFRAHRRDVKVAEVLLEMGRAGDVDMAGPEDEGLGPAELEVVRNAVLLKTVSQHARQHAWEAIRAVADQLEAMPSGILRAKALCLLARAYAESRDVAGGLRALNLLERESTWHRVRSHLRSALLGVLAVGGRQRAVDLLLKRHFSRLNAATRTAWRTRAAVAAGDRKRAEEEVESLFQAGELEAPVRDGLLAQMTQLPEGPVDPDPDLEAALDRLEGMAFLESTMVGPVGRWMVGAPGVALVLTILFAFSTTASLILDPHTALINFGAFGALWQVEPWRFLTATFLPESGFELALDVAGVLLLGSAVGSVFGRLQLWTVYLLAGLGAGIVVGFSSLDVLIVTSSAAVLGLGGVLLAAVVRCRGYLPWHWVAVVLKRVGILVLVLMVGAHYAEHSSVAMDAVGLVVGLGLGAILSLERFDLAVPARVRARAVRSSPISSAQQRDEEPAEEGQGGGRMTGGSGGA